jgi:hypothetical protein
MGDSIDANLPLGELFARPGGGDGAPPSPPPSRAVVNVSIDSPASGQRLIGDEPGALVGVNATASLSDPVNGLVSVDDVVVTVDGQSFAMNLVGGAGTFAWNATCELYRSGTLTVEAIAFGKTSAGRRISGSASITIASSLAHDIPQFTISSPAASQTLVVPNTGSSVQLSCSSSPFNTGTRQVTWALGGHGNTVPATVDQSGNQGPDTFTDTIPIDPVPIGTVQLHVSCQQVHNNAVVCENAQVVPLTLQDGSPPTLTITIPPPPPAKPTVILRDPSKDPTVSVLVQGTAFDLQSGMANGQVTVALDAETPKLAQTEDGWANWSANVVVASGDKHTIHVQATDGVFNGATSIDTFIDVVDNFQPDNLVELLNHRGYLDALLNFIGVRIADSGGRPLNSAVLQSVFSQQLATLRKPLSQTADTGDQAVNELRVPIEVLRGVPTGPGPGGPPVPPDRPVAARLSVPTETDYRTAAYTALLAGMGTSADELALARGADTNTRARLAARLGLPALDTAGKSPLDQLLLDIAGQTELALQTLFGLRSTSPADPPSDPLTPLGKPQVLTWQEAFLAGVWVGQDQAPDTLKSRSFPVIVDPDLVDEDDVVPSSSAHDVWTRRRAACDSDTSHLNSLRDPSRPQAQVLALLFADTLPGVDLGKLDEQRQQGADISGALNAIPLPKAAFEFLLRVSRLAAVSALNASEWDSVIAVLTQVRKARRYPDWLAEEVGLSVSPDFFRQRTTPGPDLNPWLTSARARQDWVSLLASRIQQRADLAAALSQIVASAEQQSLPVLRDALVARIGVGEPELSEEFQLDIGASGTLVTSQLAQAIATLQSVAYSVRLSRFPTGHAASGWTVVGSADDFDSEWNYIGTYDGWRSAMLAFRYPENLTDPTTFPQATNIAKATAAFTHAPTAADPGGLLERLPTTPQLTPAAARNLAADYNAALVAAEGLGTLATSTGNPDDSHLQQLRAAQAQHPNQPWLAEAFFYMPMLLAAKLQEAGEYAAALDWYRTVYDYPRAAAARPVFAGIAAETHSVADLIPPADWLLRLNPHDVAVSRPNPKTRFAILSIARCCLQFADAQFTLDSPGSVMLARDLYQSAQNLLAADDLNPVPQPTPPIGPIEFDNPEVTALRGHADNQLRKIHTGRDIAGMPRVLELPDLQPDPMLVGPTPPTSPPTPYRYRTLADRARQLAQLAQQMEAEFLSALEKGEQKAYELFQADNGLQMARANLAVQDRQVTEATASIDVAIKQKRRADQQAGYYADLIAAGETQHEQAMLNDIQLSGDLRANVAQLDGAVGAMGALVGGVGNAFSSWGASMGLAGIEAALQITKGQIVGKQAEVEVQQQKDSFQATYERRVQEWQQGLATAAQDGVICAAQIGVAGDHLEVAKAEQAVATLQVAHAEATVDFLRRQFTNAELYAWMSGVLSRQYAYLLQQATATARLAQDQLAFDRQVPTVTIVGTDYWQPPSTLAGQAASPDRRGLTGAERLIADLAALDQYALMSDRRLLNLSQTFSLAERAALAFQDFRRTGVLDFATPMSWFDDDFPGHCLRLVKRVRTTVIALVPPTRGIRATLTASGLSRVVVTSDGTFAPVTLHLEPETVALTAAGGSTGVFELDPQPDLRLPFEGAGVDTTWRFIMPRAANPFDFNGIADVQVTVDYTAVFDSDYQQQVLTTRSATPRGGDLSLSLRRDFPDQWYGFQNGQPGLNPPITLDLTDGDLPANLTDVTVSAVLLALLPGGANTVADGTQVTLGHGGAGGADPSAGTSGGVVSTRRVTGIPWAGLCNKPVTGQWRLGLNAVDPSVLDDVVLIVSYVGSAPAWPV